MLVLVVVAYMVDKNQNNLDFLLRMKNYIPFMLYFSLFGALVFLFALFFNQIDHAKAKKLITQLENDKNKLKAKLFEKKKEKSSASPVVAKTRIVEEPAKESPSSSHTEEEKKGEDSPLES